LKTDEIGIINWFTKELENPKRSGKEVAEQIKNEIIKRSLTVREGDISGFADTVWKVLSADEGEDASLMNLREDLMRFCADTRLPVCSLFHHMKNTAAIAVILAYSRGFDEDKIQMFRAAALLHDIGKLYAPGKGKEHVIQTENFLIDMLKKIEALSDEQKHHLIRLSTHHHSTAWYGEYVSKNEDERILSMADTIASATDRSYEVVVENFSLSKNDFRERREVRVRIRSDDSIFPHLLRFGDRADFECKEFPEITLGREEEVEVTLIPIPRERTPNQVIPFFDTTVKGGNILNLYDSPEGEETSHLEPKIGLFGLDIQGIQRFVGSAKKLPALSGGSAIVNDVLEGAKKILGEKFCPETILFAGGGNLVAFVPPDEKKLEEVKEKIREEAKKISEGGLRVAISYHIYEVTSIEKRFGECLGTLFEKIEREKNRPSEEGLTPIKPRRSSNICAHCSNEEVNDSEKKGIRSYEGGELVCAKCRRKEERGRELRSKEMPETLEDIGKTIGVVVLDGNMMGRFFIQTKTPAEYTFKSDTFDAQIRTLLEETLEEIRKGSPWLKEGEEVKYQKIYAGGDDIFIIIDARAAIDFAEKFIVKTAERMSFRWGHSTANSRSDRPTVTFSAGIAIADYKFPIYFLIEKAHQLLSSAKRNFRECVTLDEKKLFKLPYGAISVSTVTSSMPSDDDFHFVIKGGERKNGVRSERDLELLKKFLHRAISSDEWRPLISLLINTDPGEESKLNFSKYLYARALAKESIQRIAKTEHMDIFSVIRELIDGWELKKELESLVPMVWYFEEGSET